MDFCVYVSWRCKEVSERQKYFFISFFLISSLVLSFYSCLLPNVMNSSLNNSFFHLINKADWRYTFSSFYIYFTLNSKFSMLYVCKTRPRNFSIWHCFDIRKHSLGWILEIFVFCSTHIILSIFPYHIIS